MIYQFGDCMYDPPGAMHLRAGRIVHAEPQVLRVLRYLLAHRDRAVSRDELFAQCWSGMYVSDGALTSCLRRVREAIGQTPEGPSLI